MVEDSNDVAPPPGRRVLVIDDDQDFADSLATLLALEGYAVEKAYSAAEATATGFEPEVALIDIRLGEDSGLDLIEAFRRRHPGAICVMVTAYASVETAVEALKRGAYDYLCKPFITEDLLATLERCFDRLSLVRERDAVEAALRARNEELERAVTSLRRSEEHLRRIAENSPSAISLRDLHGRFLVANKQFQDWHGFDGASVVGRTAAELFPPDLAGRYVLQDREVLQAGRAIDYEVDLPFGDGTLHAVLMTTFPVLDAPGQAVGVGTIGTDLSVHKRAQEELRQAQKMEALGQLTGGVAHDFNNLLAVILGNLELLQGLAREDSETAELIEDALEASRGGGELIQRLLAFGRRQTLHPQPVDLRQLVTDMSRMLERTLGATIEVVRILPEQLWTVGVDRNQVETSLLNLALNARDAMSDGGTLTIETANVDHRTHERRDLPPGHYVMIAVTDTGAGMAPNVVEHAFQPFFTTKDASHGSGLGLSMVYGFVKQSGGAVEIASAPGRGTTVKLYLPRAGIAAAQPAAAQGEPGRGHGETILVVEDRREVRKLACKALTRLGYQVLEAHDGESALAMLENGPAIDLMLADIVLPGGISGFGLARQARRHRPDLKILYMSGYAPEALADEAGVSVAGPAIRVIRKPFAKSELAGMVRRALDGGVLLADRPSSPPARA